MHTTFFLRRRNGRPVRFGLSLLLLGCGLSAGAFELDTRIYRAGSTPELRFRAATPEEKAALPGLTVQYIREDGRFTDGGERHANREWETLPAAIRDDAVTVRVPLNGEYEHTFRIARRDGAALRTMQEITVLSLAPDLFRLRPYRGDLHMHSERSDGKYPPARVAAFGRRAGYDFLALTDHRKYSPSVEARQAAADWKCGLRIFTGEEFHTEDGVLHSLSIGASGGVNDWSRGREDEFRRLCDAELETPAIRDSALEHSDRRNAAAARVLYRRARETGAVIVYCHPFWRPQGRYNAPTRFNDFMLRTADFDAVEMPNGGSSEAMMLTVAKSRDLAARGRFLTPVGVSDTHDASRPSLGSFHTLVFAENGDLDGIAAALRDGRCVAAYLADPKRPIYLGSYRLVKYAYFLHRDYLPRHRELCRRQGELLLKRQAGDASVQPEIEQLAAAIETLRETYREAAETPRP